MRQIKEERQILPLLVRKRHPDVFDKSCQKSEDKHRPHEQHAGQISGVPYDIIKETENYYETVVFLICKILGLNCRAEVRIAAGRIDTLVETGNFVYCFEFKLDKSADETLAQINTNDYLLPWTGSRKKLFKVSVGFDREKRNIGE